MTTCTRCESTGFLNLHQVDDESLKFAENGPDFHADILAWIAVQDKPHDVQICDCCGDGTDWYGTPGEHNGPNDPPGENGPYASNGGFCRCH